jgi:hypothetical protein
LERPRLRALVEGVLVVADELRTKDFQLITRNGDSLSQDEYVRVELHAQTAERR